MVQDKTESEADLELIRRIAAAAVVDLRTVRKALRGDLVVGRAGERVRAAIAAMGLHPTLRAEAEPSPEHVRQVLNRVMADRAPDGDEGGAS